MNRTCRFIALLFALICINYGYGQTVIAGNGPFPLVHFVEGSGTPSGTCNSSFNYALVYFDHTAFNTWYCVNGGWTEGATSGGGGAPSGAAGGVLGGTYPNPTIASGANLGTPGTLVLTNATGLPYSSLTGTVPYMAITSFTVGASGVVANKIVSFDTSGNANISAGTGFGGLALTTVATSGTVQVIRDGLGTCVFDAAAVIGDVAIPSTGTPGDCHDSGFSSSQLIAPTVSIIGAIESTVASAGLTGTIRLHGPGSFGALVAGQGANTFTGGQTAPNFTDSALTSGNCVQASTGGLLSTTGSACGAGGGGAGLAANTFTGNQTAPQFLTTAVTTPNVPAAVPIICDNYAATGATTTCTWSTAPQAGDLIAIGVWAVGSSSTFTVTDSGGNTYTAIAAAHTSAGSLSTYNTQVFYAGPISAPITTTTVTSSGSSSAGLFLQGGSATGVVSSSPVDGFCTGDATATSIPCSTAITTTVANDYVYCNALGLSTVSAGSGFTAGSNYNNNNLSQFKIQSSTGSLTPAVTNSTATSGSITCAAFKPGSVSSSSAVTGNSIADGGLTPGTCVQAGAAGLLTSSAAPCGLAALPGTPNVVYSFVNTGDQTGTTVHDLSGNGNNGTINRASDGGTNYWTGTGLSFQGQTGGNTQLNVGAATSNIGNRTHCATVFLNWPGVNNSSINNVYMVNDSGGTSGWQAVASFVYGNGVYQDVSGGTNLNQANIPSEAGLHTKCWVLGNGGSADTFYTDGVAQSMQASGGGNGGDGTGYWRLGTQLVGDVYQPIWYYYASWSGQLTATQIQQASTAMTQAVAARGVPIAPPNTATATPQIRTSGDSITCCAGASTTEWYPTLLSVNSAYSSVVNEGQPGFAAWTMMEEARWRDTPACNTGGQPSLLTIFGGTNDGLFGATAAKTFQALQGFATIAKNAGCQVGVATMISRTAEDTFKDALNPLIRNGAANGGYFVIDAASSPNLGADGDYSNTTYFNTDQVHPKNAGQVILAAEFSNAINAYGIGAASAANPTVYASNAVTMVSADRYATIVPTAAATVTLPDCLGVTGAQYQITNASAGAFGLTISGLSAEAITGASTIAQGYSLTFQAELISQAAAGCGWTVVGGVAGPSSGGSGIANTTVAVTGATQGANSCSTATTQTITGLATTNVVIPGYSSSPASLTGWGTTGGMVFQAWPSATNTLSWIVCNQTASSITYSSITFNLGVK